MARARGRYRACPQELREGKRSLARRGADLLLVMAADGKAHERLILRRELLHEVELRQDLEAEVRMVLRHRIVERLVQTVLAEAPDIMEQPHNLGKLDIVLRELQVLCKLHRDRGHVSRMDFLDLDALHDFFVIGMEGFHICIHPGMHFLEQFLHNHPSPLSQGFPQ